MFERPILLVNPPLVGGVAFTRQGRCQEREEVLGRHDRAALILKAPLQVRPRRSPNAKD
jgi:hypothetical protein